MYKKRQRCGECQSCLHPHCGECKSCKSLKQFGGDNKHGGSCKLRKCKFMRFAAPEIMPKRADTTFVEGRTHTTLKHKISRGTMISSSIGGTAKSPLLERNPSSPKSHPGPGWTPKRVYEYGQYVFHWMSPIRRIEFTAHSAACKFESLRLKFESDEVKAWEEYRKQCVGKRTRVVGPHQYDAHPGCVGPEWKSKRVYEYGQHFFHWISPKRQIEFRSLSAACEFDRLRSEFGSDEFKAMKEYRKLCANEGKSTRVVSPDDYDANPQRINMPSVRRGRHINVIKSRTRNSKKSDDQQCQEKRTRSSAKKCAIKKRTAKVLSAGRNATPYPANNSPGPGWEAKWVSRGQQVYTHWISPVRRIEFRRRNPACDFERLRIKFGSDEVMAWKVFRQRYYTKKGASFVVSPQKYDAPSKRRATKKKQRDPAFVAHNKSDLQNYCDFDVCDGKDDIAHITPSLLLCVTHCSSRSRYLLDGFSRERWTTRGAKA